jgi:hypothetical protein
MSGKHNPAMSGKDEATIDTPPRRKGSILLASMGLLLSSTHIVKEE